LSIRRAFLINDRPFAPQSRGFLFAGNHDNTSSLLLFVGVRFVSERQVILLVSGCYVALFAIVIFLGSQQSRKKPRLSATGLEVCALSCWDKSASNNGSFGARLLSTEHATRRYTRPFSSAKKKRDGEGRGRNNRDRYQHNDDQSIFFSHLAVRARLDLPRHATTRKPHTFWTPAMPIL
jgi:hypothetical protein